MLAANPHNISNFIKNKALEIGFDACGFAPISELHSKQIILDQWFNKQYHGQMQYLEATSAKRINPKLILSDAKSMIVLLKNYFPKQQQPKNTYQIAKYAYGQDYHVLIKKLLTNLEVAIHEIAPTAQMKSYTDTGPILEKHWATLAGLGFIGKQSLFFSPIYGSYCFIAEIITDLEIPDLVPIKHHNPCGNCTRCIDACPTNAIVEPYIINPTKCIAYHTIESKNKIPDFINHPANTYIYGCDICQDICPHNQQVFSTNSNEFQLSAALQNMTKENWQNLDNITFNNLFDQSSVKRIGYQKLKETIDNKLKSD